LALEPTSRIVPTTSRLRATERVSRELTTALGNQAARATVGVLG
jgi:hypothetical protein